MGQFTSRTAAKYFSLKTEVYFTCLLNHSPGVYSGIVSPGMGVTFFNQSEYKSTKIIYNMSGNGQGTGLVMNDCKSLEEHLSIPNKFHNYTTSNVLLMVVET